MLRSERSQSDAAYITDMTIYDDDKHPRGQADNVGQFRDKCNSEPEGGIVIPVYASNGLTVPTGWRGECPLHPATDWMDDRMQGGDVVANPDPVNARCDYAEVDEDGIVYGYELPPSLLGDIVAGPQGADESDSDYAERVDAENGPERDQAVTEFFRERYGADAIDSGDYGSLNLEFFVPYGGEGAAGAAMQSALAAKLGYEFQANGDSDAVWVKVVND